MAITKLNIDEFLNADKFAVVGASRDSKSFSRTVIRDLRFKGKEVAPVNPNADKIMGLKSYKSVSDLPEGVDRIIVMTKPEFTDDIVTEALNLGIKHIWVQRACESENTFNLKSSDNNLIVGQCVVMYTNGRGIHGLHKSFLRLTKKLPV
jgi:predicted CoA-binding protein